MKNADLSVRRTRGVPRGLISATEVFAARADNAEVWDVEGRHYIDFAGGIAVLNVGHCHPRVMAAVREQLDRFTHTAFQVLPYPPYIDLVERLNRLAPIDGEVKTALFSTGAEATENAVKVARAATGRPAVISFVGGFHGRTFLACAMTGKILPYKKGLGPFPQEVYHLPYPSASSGIPVAETLRALNFLFSADIEPERVAAIIFEPVQGEGGFHSAPPELFEALDEVRRQHGIVLIADEVQTGFARTGRMFGIEYSAIRPDLITVAKSLGGGLPIAGLIGRAELMDAVEPGGMGSTFGGSPVSCAAALAVLDVIEEEKLVDRANLIGAKLRARIARWSERNGTLRISAPRGPGAMIAFDVMNHDGGPDGATAKEVCARALEEGLILLTCGQFAQTIRILVPLTITDQTLEQGLGALERALERTFLASTNSRLGAVRRLGVNVGHSGCAA